MKKKRTYKRRTHNAYFTEPWTIDELLKEWHIGTVVLESAAGDGRMVKRLRQKKRRVYAVDIKDYGFRLHQKISFMKMMELPAGVTDIVTNPPYQRGLTEEFIRHALSFMRAGGVKTVAMLLPTEWGNNSDGRRDLFDRNFACKLELTRRIRFIDGTKKRPAKVHAWFIWDRDHTGQAYYKLQRSKS